MTDRGKQQGKRLKSGTFLGRLRDDSSGNTLMLVAAAILPLTGMIGSAVDISRTYIVKSRLQQACDAGALAGRKFSGATNFNTDTNAQSKAQNFFKNNFPTGAFGTTNITFTPRSDASNQISAEATARVPMTVMTIFGNEVVDVKVKCAAKLEVGNTDVALVLDVTGSMGAAFGGTTRIGALKSAVLKFYETLGPGDPTDGRIRYAIIPYGQNVNVGSSLPSSAVIGGSAPDTWIYQTRVANMNTPVYTPSPGAPSNTTEVFGSAISQTNCGKYGRNQPFSGFTGGTNPVVTGTAPSPVTSVTYANNSTAGTDWGYSGAAVTSGVNRTCRRSKSTVVTTYAITGYSFTNWIYKQTSIDVTGYASGNSVQLYTSNSNPSGNVPTAGEYDLRELANTSGSTITSGIQASQWNGCIEERDTLNTINASSPLTVPNGAYDLEIDFPATNDATRWRAAWPAMIYKRNTLADANSGTKAADSGCPDDPARRLMQYASITSSPTEASGLSSYKSYVEGLTLTNGTLHDIGFVWGARFLSGSGIFSSDNPSTWAGQPVSRHIVFMTDGEMNPQPTEYTFHGINELDQRAAARGTNWSTLQGIHTRRLRILCEAAKARNMTVWVIGVGDSAIANDPDLTGCASTPSHFVFAGNPAELEAAYGDIAATISKLRLEK